MLAIKAHKLSIISMLLASQDPKVDLNVMDNDGNTPLMLAIKLEHVDIVKEFLKNPTVNLNLQNQYGWTALQVAMNMQYGSNMVKMLLDSKVDTTVTDRKGNTALMWAVRDSPYDIDYDDINDKLDTFLYHDQAKLTDSELREFLVVSRLEKLMETFIEGTGVESSERLSKLRGVMPKYKQLYVAGINDLKSTAKKYLITYPVVGWVAAVFLTPWFIYKGISNYLMGRNIARVEEKFPQLKEPTKLNQANITQQPAVEATGSKVMLQQTAAMQPVAPVSIKTTDKKSEVAASKQQTQNILGLSPELLEAVTIPTSSQTTLQKPQENVTDILETSAAKSRATEQTILQATVQTSVQATTMPSAKPQSDKTSSEAQMPTSLKTTDNSQPVEEQRSSTSHFMAELNKKKAKNKLSPPSIAILGDEKAEKERKERFNEALVKFEAESNPDEGKGPSI